MLDRTGEPALRPQAIRQALLVTALWSSSWILIKIGLGGIGPILFAGIRYAAAAVLLGLTLDREEWASLARTSLRDRAELVGLGVSLYFFTQGAQFVSLAYFPAVVPALVLNQVPVLVALASVPVLGERLRRAQVFGVALSALGTWLYFAPKIASGVLGDRRLFVPIVGLAANAVAALLGRSINRKQRMSPKAVTVASMGTGSVLLLLAGGGLESAPRFSLSGLAILGWLVVVNTAYAFTLWNQTLRTLSSVESSVINMTMLVQIAVLAWVALGEGLSLRDIGALATVMVGILLVQLRRQPRAPA